MKTINSLIEEPFEVESSAFMYYTDIEKFMTADGISYDDITIEDVIQMYDLGYIEKAFLYDKDDVVLNVPEGTKAKYEATSCWKEFFRIVETTPAAIEESPVVETLQGGSGDWYSIEGRKMAGKPVKKGIYLNNGKKFVVR